MNLSCTSRHIYNVKNSSSSKPTTAILLGFLLLNETDKESTRKTCRDAQNSSFSGGHKQCMHSEQFNCNTHSSQMIFRSPITCESWTGSQHIPFAHVFSLSSTGSCTTSKRIKPVFLFMSPWYHLLVSPKMKTWVHAFLKFGMICNSLSLWCWFLNVKCCFSCRFYLWSRSTKNLSHSISFT